MPAEPSGKGSRRPVRLGKYEVLTHIATGGMGAVYRALDTELGREVALKVLSPDLAARPAMLERFRREARSAARLRHENIVAIYEFAEANGTYFLALEFVDGIDLHDFIGKRGRLDAELARQILRQATRALAHAHEQGIVHRDIKPSNLLIARKDGRLQVKLTDLGLAREASDEVNRLTRLGSTVGTLDYMAPEQARDSAAADIRSDIYSLGCTFYHMLAGNCPFPRDNQTERVYRHFEAEIPDVRAANPGVPAGLAAVLRRMLAKRPEDRYQTPAELLRALEDPSTISARRDPEPSAAETVGPAPRPPSSTAQTQARTARSAPAGAKPPPSGPKRFRGEDDGGPPTSARPATGLPPWWPLACCVAGVGLIIVVALLSLGSSDTRPPRGDGVLPPGQEVPRAEEIKGHRPPEPGEKVKRPETPEGPVKSGAADPARLRAEFEGPLREFPDPPANPVVLRVGRSAPPGPASFRTLAAACAAAPAGRHTVLEIHDNGPLFEKALPAVSGRSLTIRAAPGYRPLIAWDSAGAAADRFLTLDKGRLSLENLDLVLKWPDTDKAKRPAALFVLINGALAARGCTFSAAGKSAHGLQIVRLEGSAAPAQCRLSRCSVRGTGLTAVAVHDAAADVLLDGCLIVSAGVEPLFDVRPAPDGACTLRVVRSTLIAGKTLLQVAAGADGLGAPAVKCLCFDAVLARPGAATGGEMIRVTGGAGIERLNWRAQNAVYAGWQHLLVSAAKSFPAAPAEAWYRKYPKTRDRVLAHPWPTSLPAVPEESGPEAYFVAGVPGFPQATGGGEAVGCDLTTLPPGRPGWVGLTYARLVMAPLTLPGGEAPPEIPAPNDNRYHGEDVKLEGGTNDLGKLLRERLQDKAHGPRVVLRVSGSGAHATSPIHLSKADLVLYFYPPEGQAKPLTLVPNAKAAGKPALIEVEGGGLEMTGVQVNFGNAAPKDLPARAVRVRGGPLRLFGCRLHGPLAKMPPEYQGLVQFDGSGKDDVARAHGCVLDECVLVSGRSLLTVRGVGARVRFQQCVLLALDDGLLFDPASATGPRLNVHCSLTRTTLAARGAAFVVKDAPQMPAGAEPIVIQADDCLFLAPFAVAPRSTVLAYEGGALARGVVLWQGKGNGYDKRLHAYVVAEADLMPPRQPHAAWANLWGQAGEQQPQSLEWPATGAWEIDPERPQLDRLRAAAPMGAPVGADLVRLEIAKE